MADSLFVAVCRRQHAAMFAMLRQAVEICPEELWEDRSQGPPLWQHAHHAISATDISLGDSGDDYTGHPEIDPESHHLHKSPPQTASRRQILEYLETISDKCEAAFDRLDTQAVEATNPFAWTGPTRADCLLHNLRHAQHHVGMMNLMLRTGGAKAADWICSPDQLRQAKPE